MKIILETDRGTQFERDAGVGNLAGGGVEIFRTKMALRAALEELLAMYPEDAHETDDAWKLRIYNKWGGK